MQKLSDPKFLITALGVVVALGVLAWFVRKIRAPPADTVKAPAPTGMFGAHATPTLNVGADVGRDTYKIVDVCQTPAVAENIDVSMNLPAPITPPGPFSSLSNPPIPGPAAESQAAEAVEKQRFLNSDDVNIDMDILKQWTLHEIPFQENNTAERNGQFWAKNWEAWGPLDPFTPRTADGQVTPGPTDPQLAYASALTASMDDQARKFCVKENPNDVTHQYLNSLQQVPGSHYETFAASWNAHDTPMVVNRRAHLPQMAARWVVMQLNDKFRKEHPCFSLSGREHFELSNPPHACGDTSNQKHNPITLIRVFESRLLKKENEQLLFMTMEIGNHVSAGAGGMFHTVVTVDNKGNFINYTSPKRDEKQTFVLPRTRT